RQIIDALDEPALRQHLEEFVDWLEPKQVFAELEKRGIASAPLSLEECRARLKGELAGPAAQAADLRGRAKAGLEIEISGLKAVIQRDADISHATEEGAWESATIVDERVLNAGAQDYAAKVLGPTDRTPEQSERLLGSLRRLVIADRNAKVQAKAIM